MELHARLAAFAERRRRVLRALGLLYGGALLAIGGLGLAKHLDERAFEELLPFVVCGGILGGLAVWRELRRHWRCPECETRWGVANTLASLHWQHCPDCGTPLSLGAAARPALDAPDPGLGRRLRSRWRWAGAAILLILSVTLAATLAGQARGWNDALLDLLAAGGAGLAVAAAAVASRCPACRRGTIAGRAGRCWHCGILIK